VFYYGWCPPRITTLWWVLLYLWILCTFSLARIYIRLHFILLSCLKKKKSREFFCAFYDCVEHQSCPNLCLACVESMVFIVCGENKRCANEACNIWLPLLGDVHVHQPKGDHWIVQSTWEGENDGMFLSLVIHGLNIFRLIIANLLCNLFISNPMF
jgi:hypothetical protein